MNGNGAAGPFASAGLDARLLAELLWLARDPPPDVPDRAGRVAAAPPPEPPASAPDPSETAPSPRERDGGERARPSVPVYPPADGRRNPTGEASGERMSRHAFPGASPLPDAMELTRALRRFRRLTRPGRPEVDIDATVQATAEARASASAHLMIQMTRPPVRSLDFALVTDTSASMRVWRTLFDRLEEVFARVGAFRTVSRWTIGVDGGTVHLADPSGARCRPSRLLDHSGTRIVLIATDAVAEHWYGRPIWTEIDRWARAMPTTLLHMLPADYRPDTAVGVPYTAARCTGGLRANDAFEVERGWWARRRKGTPLPVIGLGPEDFDRWSEALVSGTAWIPGITTAPPVLDEAPDGGHGDGADDGEPAEDPEMLVDAFFRRASPGAVRLAQMLSCATTLTLPLIGVLQARLARDTGLVERAELFVSGLLEEVGDDLYAFVPEARQRLTRAVSALEERDISRAVNEHIERRYGTGGDLAAFVRDPGGTEAGAYVRPFAQLARTLALRRGVPVPGWADPDGRLLSTRRTAADDPSRHVPASAERPVPARPRSPVEALGERLARLDIGARLVLMDVGRSGTTVYEMHRDEAGVLRSGRQPTFGWADRGVSRRIRRASRDDAAFLLTVTTTEPGLADAAERALRSARPDAVALTMPGVQIDAVLREAMEREPIRRQYALLTVEHGGIMNTRMMDPRLRTVPLFAPGSSRDATRTLDLVIEPSDERGTLLAVVAKGTDGPNRTVSVRSVKVPPGRYRVKAELRSPESVTFRGLPKGEPASWSWEELLERDISLASPLQPAHVICALEHSGPALAVGERVHRVRKTLNLLWRELGERLRVSLLFYGAHLYRAGEDPPVGELVWRAGPEEAIDHLDDLAVRRRFPDGYPGGAMVEDMLAFVVRTLEADRWSERTALLTVGDRPPHPASLPPSAQLSETLPCTRRYDWAEEMARLKRRGVTFAAICDRPIRRSDYADEAWKRLGGGRPLRLDAVDAAAVCERLGVMPTDAQRVPFPFVADAHVWGGH